ncbi:DUF3710 domain-containing protein [Pedococcus sp. 5OH_020]|uniref:DUF3710 domain-containing protein n=1 Tax=Pedococcus sp. 5OH_020 TaxID=2989814 RepID=UPI0022E9A4C3|nr:DUF3710 domain-containing protein [Pedococcus sp. 5OH_020]
MGIFRRARTSETAEASAQDAPEVLDSPTRDGEHDETQASAEVHAAAADVGHSEASSVGASQGPFDSAEVDVADDGRLDLGALRIMGVPGMELRLEVDESAGQVVAATAVIADSAVQIQAFAAPRTMGIWDEIRHEIAESILSQGGTADEATGPLGTELRTRMPSAGPDGRTVFAPARFTGVDGPRWFLRAVFSGRAANDEEAAAPLLEVVRNTVVVRGDAAMAPREMLMLTLPEQAQAPVDAGEADDGAHHHVHADDLRPFERGPEITEIR